MKNEKLFENVGIKVCELNAAIKSAVEAGFRVEVKKCDQLCFGGRSAPGVAVTVEIIQTSVCYTPNG